ncbi:MAG: Hint domain-containing protein [Pseudomonadota bacterium]
MPVYDVGIYNFDPYFTFSRTVGGTYTYAEEAQSSGSATITDNQGTGLTLEGDANGETATATITVNGNTSTNVSVEAEEGWTLLDTTTGETFQMITFRVDSGPATGYYTLSEQPLIPGRTYETVEFDNEPDADAGDPVFTYSDYVDDEIDPPDGTVSGTDGDDTIDTSYTGDPEQEQVDNGDSTDTGPPVDLDFNWTDYGVDEQSVETGITSDVGGIQVTVSTNDQSGTGSFEIETRQQYVGSGEPFDTNSSLELRSTGGSGDVSITTIDFSSVGGSGYEDEVQNLEFRINDIDTGSWQDQVEVRAFDADGNLITVNITISGNETESGGVVTAGTGGDQPNQADGSVYFNIPGPVSYIEIDYGNLLTGGQAIYVTDLHFQAVPLGGHEDVIDAGGGNDSIDAGVGDDTVYGGTGGDTINASVGDDTLFGDNDADVFQLGDGLGADTIFGGEGGTDNDTLDASAVTSGVTLALTDGEDGTVIVGADTSSFEGIETFALTGFADTFDGSSADDSFTLDAGAGDDTVTTGQSADVIDLGAGDDTAQVGQGDSIAGGDGDDTFTLTDTTGTGTITITGGEGDETTGDTLDFNGLLDTGTLVITDDDDAGGGLTGYAFLTDGTRVEFSEIENIICFARGTGILTHMGEKRIERLRPGDQIVTLDHGLQQIRWIGSRSVPAVGAFAPIVISSGVLGNSRDLVVSPQHRMLITGPQAELLFHEPEVLVRAHHLLTWDGVWRREGGTVEYFHMLFDRHEIVHADGALAESFHPGDQALDAVSQAAREEILTLFPELANSCETYGPAARLSLKAFEAELLHLP